MKKTRASRKAKRIAATIKELNDCKQSVKVLQFGMNEALKSEDLAQERASMLASELEEYKAWERQVSEIVGQYSIVLKNLTRLQVSELPEHLQICLPSDLRVLPYSSKHQPDSIIRRLLLNKLTVLSKYDQFKRAVAVSAHMGRQNSALYVNLEEIGNMPLSFLIDRISKEIARHLASNLKNIVPN